MTKETVTVTNTSSDFEDLIVATQKLLTASEEQFESIRKEKWFNRVFDMITFSQKKNIRLGEQIQTLSQAQNIFLEILVRSEAEHPTLAACIEEQQERIESITQNNLSLLKLYKKLYHKLEDERLGIIKSQDIASMTDTNKLLLSGCLRLLARIYDNPSAMQKQYFNAIHNYIGMECAGDICLENLCTLPEDTRRQILLCCLEYMFLHQNDFENTNELQDFIEHFDLGPKTIRERQTLVQEMMHARGAEGIIGKYAGDACFEDIPCTFEIAWDDENMIALDDDSEFQNLYEQAMNGDADAQCQVGIHYYDENDVQLAIYWYYKAATQGHADAQNRLGVRYENGDGVEKDSKIAVEWFQKAAAQGHTKAQCNLGIHYLYGDGIQGDKIKAFQLFSKSSIKGHFLAHYYRGLCYKNGWGIAKNIANAIVWLKEGAERGHIESQLELIEIYSSVENYEEVLHWAQIVAEQGCCIAEFMIGLCYASGLGIEKNPVEAVYWYKKAAENGNPDAMLRLAICYMYGTGGLIISNHGVVKNLQIAKDYVLKALALSESEGFIEENDYALAHRILAMVLYAINVKDNLDLNKLDIANCVPGINFISLPITGVMAMEEKRKLRTFLTTEDGRLMMQHCKTAAEMGDKYAADLMKKLRKAL